MINHALAKDWQDPFRQEQKLLFGGVFVNLGVFTEMEKKVMDTQQAVEYLLKLVLSLILAWGFLRALSSFVMRLVEWFAAKFAGVPADIATSKSAFSKTWGALAGSFIWVTVWLWIILGTPLVYWLVSYAMYLFTQIKLPDLPAIPTGAG